MSPKRSMMKQLNHTGRSIDLLKIDCEGCEWQSLPDIFDAKHAEAMKVDQLQIELHGGEKEMINILFRKADAAGMRIMHKERNQWGCNGYKCLEYAFVSESLSTLYNVNIHLLCPKGAHQMLRRR